MPAPRIKERLPFLIGQRHLDPQGLFPHLTNGGGQLLMRVRGVVQNFHGQRLAIGAVPGFSDQFDRLGVAFLLGHGGGWRHRHFPPGCGPMGQRIGRHLPPGQHVIDDDIAVNRQTQRLADAQVLQGGIAGFGQVDVVIIRTQQRKAAGLCRIFLVQTGVLARRNFGLVQLSGQIAGQRLIFIVDDQRGDGLDVGIGIIPIHRVAFPDQTLLTDPFSQHIGAIADHLARFGPGIAKLFDVGLQHRECGGRCGHLGKIGLGCHQRGHQRVIIRGRHAQLVGGHRPIQHGIRVDQTHQRNEPAVRRRGGRISGTPPGIDEITGNNRVAIRPLCLGAQGESIRQPIRADRIAERHTGDQIAIGILIIQALEQVAHNFGTRHILDNTGVD